MGRSTWMKSGLPAVAALLVAVLAPRPAPAAEPAVRIGLVNTLFRDVPEILIPIGLQPMKALMEGQTGHPGDLIPAGDADSLARQLKADEVQFGVFHGVEFAWVRQNYPTLKPLVIAVNEHTYLRAHLVVRADSKIGAAAALQGKVVALPRMSREHCRLFLERRCCPSGVAPDAFFGQVSVPNNAEDALDDVVDDVAQGAVVDEVALESYEKNKPGRAAKLKRLQQSEAFPCAVLAYNTGSVSDKTLSEFRDGLIAAKRNPKAQSLLKANRLTGFEAVPAEYEQELLDIGKAYPPPAAK